MGGDSVFLFTDIEGSARLWERAPESMGPTVERHDALLRAAVECHGGLIFKTLGDGVCAVFASADAALAAALDAQRRLRHERWPVGPLAVRMGLHAGPAEHRDGDFFGTTLNRASRILDLAHGGQVLLSAQVREGAAHLPDGARLRDLGEHRLRDLAHPERIHELVHPDLPADLAPLRSLDASPHNLPLQLTAFLGRERELEQVVGLLRRARLTTLVGAGGCGKTRLALHVSAEALPAYAAGAWLVELAVLREGSRTARAIASALRLRPEQGAPVLRQVADHIGDGSMLLLLDNCEHLLEDAAIVAHELLESCPGLTILATSREPLRVTGEAVYPVGPLALPPEGATHREEIERASACALFLELARAADFNFSLDAEGARRVASICRELDGIPLAIELAAACVRRLDLAAIERGLAHRFDLLSRGPRTAQPHHRTLQAAIDWSYGILEPDEQALYRRLSVFAGGWTLDSLGSVLGGEVALAHDRLVDHSLVERRAGRYRFLESVRAHAVARLAESAEEEREVRGRHAKFVEKLVQDSRQSLYTGDSRVVADKMECEIDNIRAALDWMLASVKEFENGLRTATAFWVFCWMRSHLVEGRRWIEAFLQNPAASGAPTKTLRDAHYGAGVLAKEAGDFGGARGHYEAALDVLERGGAEESTRATLMSALAHVERIEGNLDRAKDLYERAITLNLAQGQMRSVAGALNGLGRIESIKENYAGAREHHRRSLEIFREQGDHRGEIVALSSLGLAEHELGENGVAYGLLRESFRLCRRQRDRHHAAEVLMQIAQVARDCGAKDRARRLLLNSLAMSWHERAVFAVFQCFEELARQESDAACRDTLLGAAFTLAGRLGQRAEPGQSRAFERGKAMDIESAVAFALERRHVPPPP